MCWFHWYVQNAIYQLLLMFLKVSSPLRKPLFKHLRQFFQRLLFLFWLLILTPQLFLSFHQLFFYLVELFLTFYGPLLLSFVIGVFLRIIQLIIFQHFYWHLPISKLRFSISKLPIYFLPIFFTIFIWNFLIVKGN